MATHPRSKWTLRGALVSLEIPSLAPEVILFQYNPHTLTRSFELKSVASGPEAGQLGGPPTESIKVDIELCAVDEMEAGGGVLGLTAALASLETLISPSSGRAIANAAMAAAGTIEILPATSTMTLFVWGPTRVLPVTITELSVTEETHDARLNPISARVSLGMRVINYTDVGVTHPAFYMSISRLIATEVLSATTTQNSLKELLGQAPLPF
jgi:hypothetical protein